MPIKFKPNYTITAKIMNNLMCIESIKEKVFHLPVTPMVLNSLRETARLYTTHYSTMIEGNQLEPGQIREVIKYKGHFPGRKREEGEVKGYYTALVQVEKWAEKGIKITEKHIQTLHALVMANGRKKVQTSKYREGHNVIRDGRTREIIYMPPEAKDVKGLMTSLINWINYNQELPSPLVAAIVHYQFVTIHPYYDGNGRTARLLTTLILYLGGYDLKGIYSLEEYYARNLGAYYEAISIGESHNYYMGRAEAVINKWIEYFIEGMVFSFKKILKYMMEADKKGFSDQNSLIRKLDPRQRKVLKLFQNFEIITSRQIGELFGFKSRTSTALCSEWVKDGFLVIFDPSNKGRKYKLSKQYEELFKLTNNWRS